MAAVLLLAYRRWQNMEEILDKCRMAGASPIYIHVDGGRNSIENAETSMTFEVSSAYKAKWGIDIRIAKQNTNLGCSVSMISSLNSIFLLEEQIIVLEDDCMPTSDFFRYIEDSFKVMKKNSSIAVACGAQFAPAQLIGNEWMLSRYPLNWGWAISKAHWKTLSTKVLMKDNLSGCSDLKLSKQEKAYWDAGSRRALEGYTDVWDTLLVREMLRHNLYSILPAQNLVANIGNDSHALHTYGEKEWTNFPTGEFTGSTTMPIFNESCDEWMRKKFYGISLRHLASTKITLCLDATKKKRKRKPLKDRIHFADVNFCL